MKIRKKRIAKMCLLFFIICLIFSFIMEYIQEKSFDMNCMVYLERTINADSVKDAKINLRKAIRYAEENGLTQDLIKNNMFSSPSNSISKWYDNLTKTYEMLNNVDETEEEYILSEVRCKLLDNSNNVLVPSIELNQNNAIYIVIKSISCVCIVASLFFLI